MESFHGKFSRKFKILNFLETYNCLWLGKMASHSCPFPPQCYRFGIFWRKNSIFSQWFIFFRILFRTTENFLVARLDPKLEPLSYSPSTTCTSSISVTFFLMKPHGPIWDEYVPLDLDGSVLTHKKDFKRATIVHCKHCEWSLESPKRMQNHFDKNRSRLCGAKLFRAHLEPPCHVWPVGFWSVHPC